MSQILRVTMENIWWAVGDTDPGNRVFKRERLYRGVGTAMQKIAARPGLGKTSQSVALVAGTATYALSGVQNGTFQVIRSSDNWPLEKMTLAHLHDLYAGNPAPTGEPEVWALYESTAQAMTIKVAPTPTANEAGDTLTVWYETVPSNPAADGDNILFSVPLLKALELDVASDLLLSATPEQLMKLGRDSGVTRKWLADSEALIQAEITRIRRSKRGGSAYVLGRP